jgi:hypothetical protein
VKVGFDVSPLAQTRAGTARYLRNLLHHLSVDVERHAFGGAGRGSTLARELVWYPFVLPRVARGADVLHCPTFHGPFASPVPLVVTVHDLAPFRHPQAFNRWTRTTAPLVRGCGPGGSKP